MDPKPNEAAGQPEYTTTPPPIVNPENKPKKSHKMLFFILGLFIVLILIGGIGGGYYFGRNTITKELNPSSPAISPKDPDVHKDSPTPEAMVDETANWNIITIKKLNMEFKLPPKLVKEYMPLEKILTGETGTVICIIPENQYPTLSPGQRAGGCFGTKYALASISSDYTEGRGGTFMDYSGFLIKNGKYYIKSINNSESEIKSDLVKEAPNQYGVKIINVKGKNFIDESGEWPEIGSPGKGHFGAHINTKNSIYPGITFMMDSSIITEKEFDQILSTFKFTN